MHGWRHGSGREAHEGRHHGRWLHVGRSWEKPWCSRRWLHARIHWRAHELPGRMPRWACWSSAMLLLHLRASWCPWKVPWCSLGRCRGTRGLQMMPRWPLHEGRLLGWTRTRRSQKSMRRPALGGRILRGWCLSGRIRCCRPPRWSGARRHTTKSRRARRLTRPARRLGVRGHPGR